MTHLASRLRPLFLVCQHFATPRTRHAAASPRGPRHAPRRPAAPRMHATQALPVLAGPLRARCTHVHATQAYRRPPSTRPTPSPSPPSPPPSAPRSLLWPVAGAPARRSDAPAGARESAPRPNADPAQAPRAPRPLLLRRCIWPRDHPTRYVRPPAAAACCRGSPPPARAARRRRSPLSALHDANPDPLPPLARALARPPPRRRPCPRACFGCFLLAPCGPMPCPMVSQRRPIRRLT